MNEIDLDLCSYLYSQNVLQFIQQVWFNRKNWGLTFSVNQLDNTNIICTLFSRCGNARFRIPLEQGSPSNGLLKFIAFSNEVYSRQNYFLSVNLYRWQFEWWASCPSSAEKTQVFPKRRAMFFLISAASETLNGRVISRIWFLTRSQRYFKSLAYPVATLRPFCLQTQYSLSFPRTTVRALEHKVLRHVHNELHQNPSLHNFCSCWSLEWCRRINSVEAWTSFLVKFFPYD